MVEEIYRLFQAAVPGTASAVARPGEAERSPFALSLQETLHAVNRLQREADEAAVDLVLGRLDSLHHLMIAAEKAQISLQLSVQVVNKVIQAYQEISRLQL